MQAIMETIFNVLYLSTVITLGLIMLSHTKENKMNRLFGAMTLLLGFGDAFHLVPRSYALFTTGLEANATALGFGKFVTSITMTVFYVILYRIWIEKYRVQESKTLSMTIYSLAVIRIVLCLFPQNDWFNFYQPVSWGIYRNLPFAIMGAIILVLFYQQAKKQSDLIFKFMWLAITLSFGFYVPVVLWAKTYSWIGMLMIPKTIAYVWIVIMGFKQMRQTIKGRM
ncbi:MULTISPECIES: hypothetical protein [unclassified Fusibacter]|uniref:hypothetical protein n=1 Tax=unclassified Fusibacter TaxID=2624464 RepID=UPI001012A575|nr:MULTISPECIES: hypothetical protein [unclassified Fusibacter]MCK8060348.1 hypothetical protein [Fusibacter sp. A2]NPE20363.1 hypothetical protein [Fusibacter sp. A1]RXV63569.1 hypothetical protein DWB64_00925 [Fusibacter sp. A1]